MTACDALRYRATIYLLVWACRLTPQGLSRIDLADKVSTYFKNELIRGEMRLGALRATRG